MALKQQFAQDHVLYEVDEETEAAQVDDYWNAENTSQRIVDFAMSFAGEDADEEFIEEVRAAVMEGFAQAKEVLGNIPDESAKLFNDTYDAAMLKFDELFLEFSSQQTQSQFYSQNYPSSNPSAPSHQLELVA